MLEGKGRPQKTWWDGSFDLSQEDAQVWNKWRKDIEGDNCLTKVYLENGR